MAEVSLVSPRRNGIPVSSWENRVKYLAGVHIMCHFYLSESLLMMFCGVESGSISLLLQGLTGQIF